MGRRSINTTKSGKYMNPTDQVRKEARKKELKKNKKQRQMVRQAVLKGKDPIQIIAEMEKIDTMEYNVLQPAPLNEKMLKEKRKKLRETLDRLLKLYQKVDPGKWEVVKRMEAEYEKRRLKLVTQSEAIRHAQQVHVGDIPLPLVSGIPLPDHFPPGILSRRSAYSPLRGGLFLLPTPPQLQLINERPPGVPPGPPPQLFSDEEDNNPMFEEKTSRTIRFAETDSDESDDENIRYQMHEILPPPPPPPPSPAHYRDDLPPDMFSPLSPLSPRTVQLPIDLPLARPFGILGRRSGPPPCFLPRLLTPSRLSPGPPPGWPRVLPSRLTPIVLTAAPKLFRRNALTVPLPKGPTVEAKTQTRNISAAVTRFVPTVLRVKKEDTLKLNAAVGRPAPVEQPKKPALPTKPQQQTMDDAYSHFMKEMQDLL